MVDDDDGAVAELESRPPTVEDLVRLCRRLNEEGVRYVIVGGMAIIQLGLVRATEDIDLLVEASADNFERIVRAMAILEDNAIRDVRPTDLDDYVVVRVADEFVVDLMKAACGVEYEEARHGIVEVAVGGVTIPFASATLMLRLKQTVRDKDRVDREFLERRLRGDA